MGEDIARCPSCSLIIRVIFDPVSQSFCDDLFCAGHVPTKRGNQKRRHMFMKV